jgi:hypothetical protein
MKKNILKSILLCCGVSLVFACSKEKIASTPQPATNSTSFDFRTDKSFNETFAQKQESKKEAREKLGNELINQIYQMEDEEARKIAYSMLSNDDKLVYWLDLTEFKINCFSFNASQRELLFSLREATVNSTMFNSVELQEIFRVEYLPRIARQIEEAGISGDQMDKIFVSGSSTDIRIPGMNRMKCICNATSMFGCRGCKSGGCIETSSGCGFVFWFRCDGDCSGMAPIPNRNDSN